MSDKTFVVEDQPDLSIPEDTIVRAVLSEVVEENIPYTDKKTGEAKSFDKLNWWFEVTTPEYKGRKIRGETDAKISNHPNNKFRAWAETLLNRELGVGTGVCLSDLVGLSCDISVGKRQDRKDPQKYWDYVDEVLPAVGSPAGAGGWNDEPPF